MTAGCAALSHRTNKAGCPVWPLPGQGQLWTRWHAGDGVSQSGHRHPQVFSLCSGPAGSEDIIFLIFLIRYTSPVCVQSSRKECLKFWCRQRRCRTSRRSTQPRCTAAGQEHTRPVPTPLNIPLPNSWRANIYF